MAPGFACVPMNELGNVVEFNGRVAEDEACGMFVSGGCEELRSEEGFRGIKVLDLLFKATPGSGDDDPSSVNVESLKCYQIKAIIPADNNQPNKSTYCRY
uniref:Uncharacterized protein n=1 Tax=Rhabditophanes sp. KR3021 TaxID=114890 RepID=A0AC35UIM8_9BILA